MSAFKQGQKVIHDWYSNTSCGSRVFTFVRLIDPQWAIVTDAAGHQCTLGAAYLKPFSPAPAPRFIGRWMVWSPTGQTNPTVLHASKCEARKVAREMAERHGGEFYAVCIGPGYRQPRAVKPPIEVLE